MPVLLYRYLLAGLIPSFGVGLLIFTLVLLMNKIMRIVDWIVRKGVSPADVFKIFGCLLPSFFVLTLPTALLLGVLLTFSRMYADNELYALKTSGVSLYGLLPPVFAFGILVSAGSLFLTGWAGPQSTRMVTSMFYSMATQNLFVGLKERVFFESLPGFVLYAENIVHEENKIKGVIIADQGLPEEPIYYFAEEGLVRGNPKEGNISLLLKNGTIHRAANSEGVYQLARFRTYWVKFDLAQMLMPRTVRKPAMEELTLPELREEIREQQAEGKDVRKLQLNYQQRLALPFGALVFCALGVPLALLSQQAVRYTGFSLSIGVVLLYYILMQAGSGLTFAGGIPALLGAWLPNLALGTLGVYLMWRKAEEKPVKILEAYAQLVQDLQMAIRRRFQGRS